jgi:hypothetical protein
MQAVQQWIKDNAVFFGAVVTPSITALFWPTYLVAQPEGRVKGTGPIEIGPVLAPCKLGRGGRDVGSTSETFQWNPAGNQARPVERSATGSESCVGCREASDEA